MTGTPFKLSWEQNLAVRYGISRPCITNLPYEPLLY